MMITQAMAKITARTGKAYRSNAWTRLCPKNPSVIMASTTMTRHSGCGQPVRVFSASAPLTLLTANQPIPATTAFSPAGRTLPR